MPPMWRAGSLSLGSVSQLGIVVEPTHSWELVMEEFVHQRNMMFLRMQLDETPDETRRLMLLKLLAEEKAKDQTSHLEK